jgi:hypothetical protein
MGSFVAAVGEEQNSGIPRWQAVKRWPLSTDPVTLATPLKDCVWAGDAVTGAATVVQAMEAVLRLPVY